MIHPDGAFSHPAFLKTLMGWNCWGCGGQRAFHHLLHGDLHRAFQLNALVFPVMVILAYVFYWELKIQSPSYAWLRRKDIRIIMLTLLAGFTTWRNIYF